MDAATKIVRARVQMLIKFPFFGYLALHLEPTPMGTHFPETAGTDGKRFLYSPKFIDGLTEAQIEGLFAHETLHCAFGHLWRRSERDKELWNTSCDLAINPLIQNAGLELPPNGCVDLALENMSAEQIYAKLEQMERDKVKGQYGDSSGHETWGQKPEGDSDDKSHSEEEKGTPEEQGSSEGDQPLEGLPRESPGKFEQFSEEQIKEMMDEWQERLIQAAHAAQQQGKLPGSLSSLIGDIVEPRLDWKTLLRLFILSAVKSNYVISPPNKKHLWREMYLPSLRGESVDIAIAIDSSGSISNDDLRDFLSEIKGIMDQFTDYTLHLIVCDARVQDVYEIGPMDDLPVKIRGRGGTDFRPVFREIGENNWPISGLVFFTDTHGDFPDSPPDYPVLWVVTDERQEVPWGVKVCIRQ